jgi:hypothetical protein
MGTFLAAALLVTGLIALATRGNNPPSSDRTTLVTWFHTYGKQASASTEQLYTLFLAGLNRSKVNNGGPGILNVQSMCQEGATNLRTFAMESPPVAGSLRSAYINMMHTGSSVFAHCLAAIAATATSVSKHDVTVMLMEMTPYSGVITTYEHELNVAHL